MRIFNIRNIKNMRSPLFFAYFLKIFLAFFLKNRAFSYCMLLSEQQRCDLQGFTKSVLNSIKAAKTCKNLLISLDFSLVSQCFYDYYSHLPAYSAENKEVYERERSKVRKFRNNCAIILDSRQSRLENPGSQRAKPRNLPEGGAIYREFGENHAEVREKPLNS